jgi:hypothetical protein
LEFAGDVLPPYNGTPRNPDVLITGNGDGNVRLWDSANGKLLLTLAGHRGRVCSVVVDFRELASLGCEDSNLRMWSLPSGEAMRILEARSGSLAQTEDGTMLLALGTGDGQVRFWDGSGAELHPLQAHTSAVTSVAWSQYGRWLATGSQDKTVKVWKRLIR